MTSLEALKALLAALKGGEQAVKLATWSEESHPPCHPKLAYEGRGIPILNKRVVVHSTEDGKIQIRALEPDKEPWE